MSFWSRWFGGASPAVELVRWAPGRAGEVVDALKTVQDPELGRDLVTLGLIRHVQVEGDDAFVRMTLTTRGCPLSAVIVGSVEAALRQRGFSPEVELVWDPPWEPSHMGSGATPSG